MISTLQDSSAGAAIGIDVGGTKVAVGVVTRAGHLLASHRLEVAAAPSFALLLDEAATRARELRKVLGEERVVGVGVGMPELVDPTGEVRTSSVIPWSRRDLVRAFGALGPVVVQADVRAAALAEARFGAGRNWSSFVYVTVGTGISCSFVQNGQPYAGAHGAAQLLGSGRLALRCPHCDLQSTSVALEDCAGGPALLDRFGKRTGSRLRGVEEVFAQAAAGNLVAAEVLGESADAIGSFVAFLVGLLDPFGVIIGGGLGLAGGWYWDRLVSSAREHIWAEYVRSIPIKRAGLGTNAGVIGAGYEAIISRQRTTEPAHGPSVRGEEGTESKEVRAC
jgi:glucokinase